MTKTWLGLRVAICGFFFLTQSLSAQQPAAPTQKRIPILVELFTSEGCSTCPPADRLLINLKQNQPVDGVQIVALGFHVDYWDHQGWRDRFSSPEYTKRQQMYAEKFHDEIYTPQLVVEGVTSISDSKTLPSVLSKAAAEHKPLDMTLQQNGETVELQIRGGVESGEAFVALVEDNLETSVGGGENQGHQLHHAAVVRDWRPLGRIKSPNWSGIAQLKLPPDANKNNLQAVGLVQDPGTGKILGLAAIPYVDSNTGASATPK